MRRPIPKKYLVPRESSAHRKLGLEAAAMAASVLHFFEKENPKDKRPREAIKALRAWASGKRKLGMSIVRELSLSSHAAARKARTDTARFAARAAGQAIATWHVPAHAFGARLYAKKAENAAKEKAEMKR
jgi:hypothetical protein